SPGAPKEQRVWAKVGDLVVLPCHLSPQELQRSRKQLYEKTAVRWEQHGESSHKELHMVLEVEYSGLLKRARSMVPRASVRETGFRQGDFSLWIEPLLSEDAGHYEALVRYGKETRRCQLELGVVTVTVNPPGLLVETEPLLLNCNSSHPAKLVDMRWFHNGSLDPISSRFRSRHGALSISRPTVSDSGPWRCELTYSDDERVSASFNLQILGFAGPVSPVVYAAVGSVANLPCLLNRDPSASSILGVSARWSHLAGGDLKIWDISRNGSNGSFTLHLPEVGPQDAGQYSCAVSIHGTTITRDVTLAVMTGEQWKPRGCQGHSSPPVTFTGLEKISLHINVVSLGCSWPVQPPHGERPCVLTGAIAGGEPEAGSGAMARGRGWEPSRTEAGDGARYRAMSGIGAELGAGKGWMVLPPHSPRGWSVPWHAPTPSPGLSSTLWAAGVIDWGRLCFPKQLCSCSSPRSPPQWQMKLRLRLDYAPYRRVKIDCSGVDISCLI
uniref:Lymphocyte activation gene 3 protein n=1 Tax=Chelonoidis abingdonii TaxID=106734 RepID=A0A8C0GY68_CHEAB